MARPKPSAAVILASQSLRPLSPGEKRSLRAAAMLHMRASKQAIPVLSALPIDATMRFYRGKFKLAIVDALNVLGSATSCSAGANCPGCAYERLEVLNILYGALGLVLDFDHPRTSYDQYTALRDAFWRRSPAPREPRLARASTPKSRKRSRLKSLS